MGSDELSQLENLPNFQRLIKNGKVFQDVESIFVTNTYPIHTSIATGKFPMEHGIISNTLIDPIEKGRWCCDSRYIQRKTLWQAAKENGLKIASVLWPVTGHAKEINWNIPEIVIREGEKQIVENLKAGSIVTQLGAAFRYKHLLNGIAQPNLDTFGTNAMCDIIRKKKPDLMFLHLTSFDTICHKHGRYAEKTQSMLGYLDTFLGMILNVLESDTAVLVFSDHAQLDVHTNINLNAMLEQVASEAGQPGDFWWGVGTSIATAVVALTAPIIGAIADIKGRKKVLFGGFLCLGLIFSLVAAFSPGWKLMLVGYVFSLIGFAGANLINDSFLTDITSPDRMDTVSSLAYGFGYIGGSTIPFLVSIFLIMFGENFGVDGILAIKLSVVIMVLWWALFSIPFLKNVKQNYGLEKPKKDLVKDTFLRVWQTAKKIFTHKAMFLFILAYFFYIDGVNTVISMSTSYGSALGLDTTGMILALLVTQIVAFPCAILFGRLSRNFGSINMLLFAIGIYFVICALGFIMGFGLEQGFLTIPQATMFFWTLAVLVGTVQGGIQALSRSFFGKLVPPESSGEFFGFFDIFGKFAAVLGPIIYSTTFVITGRSSFAILSIAVLFLVGLVLLLVGKKEFKAAERAMKIAQSQ